MFTYSKGEYTYLNLLSEVILSGDKRGDRTKTGTYSVFGRQVRYDLSDGFPLLTSKRVHFKSILTELLWFLRGDTNTAYLHEHGCTIWDEWADENGDLGPVYGKQWRSWPGVYEGAFMPGSIDQIAKVIESLKNNPESRRHIVSAWNPAQVDEMAIPPCHALFQFYVEDGKLSCQLYQRSADLFLGVPFNIASYALLTHIIAHYAGLKVGEFIHAFGDVHVYRNHVEQVAIQLSRVANEHSRFPQLNLLDMPASIDDLTHSNFALLGYQPQPAIPAPVAI